MVGCELCQEVSLDGAAATGPFSRLIYRTPVVDVLSGIGSIAPGYVLLVPRRHVASTGELRDDELRHTFQVAWQVAGTIRQEFGGFTVLVEHGSSGERHRAGRACIEHSHLHLFPVEAGVDPNAFVADRSTPVRGLDELSRTAAQGRNYYYCSWNGSEGFFSLTPDVVSQHARRVWARLVGFPDQWDWAAFPHIDNCRLTVNVLARHALPVWETEVAPTADESSLDETIKAYNSAAEWYSTHTSTFPQQSSLQAEIERLARETTGWVLDAGAGSGRDALHFASLERNVIAMDAAVELVQRIPAKRGVFPVAGDVRELPLRDGLVGAIWCSAVLLHLDGSQVVLALREFFRVLERGGLAQISMKEIQDGQEHLAERIPDRPGLVRHFYFYDLDDLKDISTQVGFEVAGDWTEDQLDQLTGDATVEHWIKFLLRKPTE